MVLSMNEAPIQPLVSPVKLLTGPPVPPEPSQDPLKDPRWYVETLFWIIDKSRERVPFVFNPAQSTYYKDRTHFDLILKSRKEGFSSLIEAIWLHACLTQKNVRAVVLSHDYDATRRHFEKVRYYLDNLGTQDQKISVDLDTESQKELSFPKTGSSYWIGTAGSKTFGRGDDITHLHLSECSHYQNQDVITAVMEACVGNAWRVMETTANGMGEKFHGLWKIAETKENESVWKPHFFAWFDDPTNRVEEVPAGKLKFTQPEIVLKKTYKLDDRQVLWYRHKKKSMIDPSKMPQEYPSNALEAFLSSGRPVFNQVKLNEKREIIQDEKPQLVGALVDDGSSIKLIQNEEGCLRVWKPPRQGRRYLIASDIAEGIPGGDLSVAQVIDRSSWEQVAVMRGRYRPGLWGQMLVDLGYYYHNAILIPENNSIGIATIETILETGYQHILKSSELFGEGKKVEYGFPTNTKTRGRIISAIMTSLDEDTAYINDSVTLGEMSTFILNEKTGKMEAQQGCYDDCVISYGIGIYALKHLTMDETYSEQNRLESDAPMVVTSAVPERPHKRRRGRV